MIYQICRKVLLMVKEMHDRGYQLIRISPGMAPSGNYWRCSVTAAINISSTNGAIISLNSYNEALVARYSSADKDRYFGWDDTLNASPRELADLFIERFPEISKVGFGRDWNYAGWFQWMLQLTQPDSFPIAYADYDLPLEYLRTVGNRSDIKVPLPPPGLAGKKKGGYFSTLSSNWNIDHKTINILLERLKKHLKIEPIPQHLLKGSGATEKITEKLARLPIFSAFGLKSWGGLVVAFPGKRRDLTTENLGTPYVRKILYPMLELHKRLQKFENKRLPCIYILGETFPDVILRKFNLLREITPHAIILTGDLLKSYEPYNLNKLPDKISEAWVQKFLCNKMNEENGLNLPSKRGNLRVGLIATEVPTWEGTKYPERLDILSYDKDDHSLVAFEIKGLTCNRTELENLFFQGLEHRNWVEVNKMAVKFIFDGPNGKRISTKKRVKLIFGFCAERIPDLFIDLKNKAERRDPHLIIDFFKFQNSGDNGFEVLSFDLNHPAEV